MATVVLVGTLDTKGPEYEWLSVRLRESGCDVVLVDAGVMPSPRRGRPRGPPPPARGRWRGGGGRARAPDRTRG
ncbi:Tm-1-like ATP-binding domain-containing protein, partial [Streptomyces sp. NPDC059616]|uniref:Tm-1-like ATP-binding domain-containing protein n=1 Tax=Streptomyces sp. NPDC059616 TaxID=3346886 RepID=UPI0036BA2706